MSTSENAWISADSHVNEVPETWERVQRKHGDLAPKVVSTAEGTCLVVEGWTERGKSADRRFLVGVPLREDVFCEEVSHEFIGLAIGKQGDNIKSTLNDWRGPTGSFTGNGSIRAEEFRRSFRFQDYPGPGSDPQARLDDQDADGVTAEVLFPSYLARLYALSATNEPFFRDIVHSYNDWLIEDFTSHNPQRLIGQPVLSVLDPEGAAADLRRYAARGVKGCVIASSVPSDLSYGDRRFDPIWDAAQECDLPLAMHTGMGGFKSLGGNKALAGNGLAAVGPRIMRQFIGTQLEVQATLAELVHGGVFDRFPQLKLVSAEFDIGWVSHVYQLGGTKRGSLDLKLSPAEYLERNVWFTFQDDRAGCLTAPVFGEKNFMWASDYPHPATTWPNSAADLDRQFVGIDDKTRRQITWQNVIDLYKLKF